MAIRHFARRGKAAVAAGSATWGSITGTISAQTDLAAYVVSQEANDLSAAVTWANVPDANITQSSVVQHEASLTIIEGQITGAAFTNWNTAFSWGDHAGLYEVIDATIVRTGDAAWNATDWDTAFGWGDHAAAGYADGTNEANWDTAFGWGDHASGGYEPALSRPVSGDWWGDKTPVISSGGVMEVGKYIDFHEADAGVTDYDVRITASANLLTVGGALTTTGDLLVQNTVVDFIMYETDASTDEKYFVQRSANGNWKMIATPDATPTSGGHTFIQANRTGASITEIDILGGADLRIRDGGTFRVQNTADTDYVTFSHDGTDFNMVGTNTGSLKVGGATLKIQETSAAVADTAAYGQLWVKNTTPNELWFTDDAGNDKAVSTSATSETIISKYKTGNTTRTSTTTLADDPQLANMALQNDRFYKFDAYILVECPASAIPDFKWTFQFSNTPAGSDMTFHAITEAASTLGVDNGSMVSTYSINMTSNQRVGIRITGTFFSNATTGGTLDFQWAQNVSNANGVIVYQNSYFTVTDLGPA